MAEITLSRERILGAAINLVDRDGLRSLNMRRLAAELGVGTMSLYHYVTDKEALLEGIAEVVMEGIADLTPGTTFDSIFSGVMVILSAPSNCRAMSSGCAPGATVRSYSSCSWLP